MAATIITIALLSLQWAWGIACLIRREMPELPREMGRVWAYGSAPLAFSLAGMAAATAGAVYCLCSGDGLMAYAAAAVALAFTGLLTQSTLPCLRFNENRFVYRTAFGRVRECRWEELLGVAHVYRAGDWLVTEKGCVCLDLHTEAGRRFRDYALKRKLHGKGNLPEVVKTPFGGGRLRLTTLNTGLGLAIASAVLLLVLLGGVLFPGALRPMNLFVVLTAFVLAATAVYWLWVWTCIRTSRAQDGMKE